MEVLGRGCFLMSWVPLYRQCFLVLRNLTSYHSRGGGIFSWARYHCNNPKPPHQTTRDARFTAGGGCAELRIAAHLKELSLRTPGLEQVPPEILLACNI